MRATYIPGACRVRERQPNETGWKILLNILGYGLSGTRKSHQQWETVRG